MTEKEIMMYRQLKQLKERKQRRLEELESTDVSMVAGKVKSSSKSFPYIETYQTVYMEDPIAAERKERGIKVLKQELKKMEDQIEAIEDYIEEIEEPEIRNIFEMRVYDGMKWIDIAIEIDEDKDRTTYSKKFKKYLANSHHSPLSQIKVI